MQDFKLTYDVDLVFCIDATGSMGDVIGRVKKNALNLYDDITRHMQDKQKTINRLRVRLIAFRDYVADGGDAMLVTDFFNMPGDAELFSKVVNSIRAEGGGDEPEDGLEALGYAIRSKWSEEGIKRREVIVLWTDASTHELGYGAKARSYPEAMAKDFGELTTWWGDKQMKGYMDQNAKRLLLFAPGKPYWTTISDNWDNVIHYMSIAGNGLKEIDYDVIINTIVNSI